jgi:hypothetical protein
MSTLDSSGDKGESPFILWFASGYEFKIQCFFSIELFKNAFSLVLFYCSDRIMILSEKPTARLGVKLIGPTTLS